MSRHTTKNTKQRNLDGHVDVLLSETETLESRLAAGDWTSAKDIDAIKRRIWVNRTELRIAFAFRMPSYLRAAA